MKEKFLIGKLGPLLGRPVALTALFVQLVAIVTLAAGYHGRQSSEGCLYCHADKARMEKAGYPQFYCTQAGVEKESRMPGVRCIDCHLGDGRAHDKDKGHKGMLKLLLIDGNAEIIPRKGRLDSLVPTGDDRMYALFPKTANGAPDGDIFTVLWHDRDKATLGYDPGIAKRTCGRKGCHEQEAGQFAGTVMGGNVRQRSSRHWLDRHGPNNCGPSFADLPPGSGAGYSEDNYRIIRDELSCPSTYKDATDRQRFCNVCHAGCLDCHYHPTAKEGVHNFTRRIPSTSCTGGGRGTGMCHSGSQERRRGDSYLGAEFSQPPGFTPDAHVKEGLECMDCHETGEKGMGDMTRQVDCSGCHYSACKALASGVHRKLRCQACHVTKLGGYEMTVWGKGHISGRPSPFKKYSLYYGVMEPPIIIKDREGMYTPYKLWPNIATNIKAGLPGEKGAMSLPGGLQWRWPGGETRDAYALLGTYARLPGANSALAWIQFEAVGHALGKSRSCRSCHGDSKQKAHETWEYLGYAGSDPFKGAQDVIADKDALRIVNIHNLTGLKPLGDANLWDFAAWMYLGDIWRVKGDFSIPRSDPKKYANYLRDESSFARKLEAIEARLGRLDKTGVRHQWLEREIKKLRDIGLHDPAAGLAEIKKAGL